MKTVQEMPGKPLAPDTRARRACRIDSQIAATSSPNQFNHVGQALFSTLTQMTRRVKVAVLENWKNSTPFIDTAPAGSSVFATNV